MRRWGVIAARLVAVMAVSVTAQAHAQRTEENAVRAADDAFGVSLGNERIGVYYDRDVRGFSPIAAGNVRVEGVYFDMRGTVPTRLVASAPIKVGLTAQGYPFPAPTGIVDYQFKVIPTKPLYSALAQVGPNEGYSYEFDAYLPIDGKKLGIMAGGVVRREEPTPGLSVQPVSLGSVLRWKPHDKLAVMGFYGHYDRYGQKANANVFVAGGFLPPEIEAQRFTQDWMEADLSGDSYGSTLRATINKNWTFHAGAFRYFQLSSGSTSESYLNTDATGLAASRRVSRDPQNKLDSYSGEARASGVFTEDNVRHTLHFTFRTREAMRTFGGNALYTPPGAAQIGVGTPYPEPAWTFGQQSRDEVGQSNFGAAYQIALRGVGEASVGVQKADYRKVVSGPLGTDTMIDSPLLHNFTLALTPTDKLVLYGSYTRGLEDANNAPVGAANEGEAPPSIRTEQMDVGLRYKITPRVNLVAGWFNIEKPYFAIDGGTNIYRELGIERHRGYEISLAGLVTDELNVVAGAVIMEPVVIGAAVDAGLIGERPVTQPETMVRLNVDYRPAWKRGLSLDAAVNYTDERAVSPRLFPSLGNKQLMTEGYATLDLGMRYRFKGPGGNPATLRLLASNVTDEFAWQPLSSGALQVNSPRAFQASIAVDF